MRALAADEFVIHIAESLDADEEIANAGLLMPRYDVRIRKRQCIRNDCRRKTDLGAVGDQIIDRWPECGFAALNVDRIISVMFDQNPANLLCLLQGHECGFGVTLVLNAVEKVAELTS